MQTIYDHKLYTELKKNPSWENLWDNSNPAHPELKNASIPVLAGGLDRITKTKKYITFHDIGSNGRDKSFRIGDQPLYIVCYSDNPFFGTPYHLYEVKSESKRPNLALTEDELIALYRTGKYRFVTNSAHYRGVSEQTIADVIGDFK